MAPEAMGRAALWGELITTGHGERTAPLTAPDGPDRSAALLIGHLVEARWAEAEALLEEVDPTVSPLHHGIHATVLAGCLGQQAGPAPAADLSDPIDAFGVLMHAAGHLSLGMLNEAYVLASQLLAEAVMEPVTRAWVHLVLGRYALYNGELATARTHWSALISDAVTVEHRRLGEGLRAISWGYQGKADQIDRWCAELQASMPHPRTNTHALTFLLASGAQSLVGNVPAAAEMAEHGSGGPRLPVTAPASRPLLVDVLVDAALLAGDVDRAVAAMQMCAETDLAHLPMARAALGRAAAQIAAHRGEHDRISGLLAVSTDGAHASGASVYEVRADVITGAVEQRSRVSARSANKTVRQWAGRELSHAREVIPGAPVPAGELTERQWAVVARVVAGATNRQIAEDLEISLKTVEKHLTDIFRRTGTSSRAALVRWVAADGGSSLPT